MSIKHNWHSYRPNNPEKEVSSTEWNAAHLIDPKSIPINALNTTGTPSATTFLNGSGAWTEPSGGGGPPVIPDGSITMTKLATTGTPSSTTFLNGNGVWATPTGGGGPGPSAKMHYQYLIYLDGGNAIAVDSNGTQIASAPSGACTSVFQAVINQNPTGIIAIGPGDFGFNTSLKLQNIRSYLIIGSGGFSNSTLHTGTRLINDTAGDDFKLIEIVDSGVYNWSQRSVTIRDLNLRTRHGYGLYCNLPAHNTQPGGVVSPRFHIQNLVVESRVGFYINTLYNSHFSNIYYYSEQDYSNMFHLTHTSPGTYGPGGVVNTTYRFHCGNSNFFDMFCNIDGPHSIGIHIDQTGGTGWLNEMSFWGTMILGREKDWSNPADLATAAFTGIQFSCNTANSGNIAMIMFNDMRIETCQHAIRLVAKPTTGLTPYGKIFNCTFNNLYCNSYIGPDVFASGDEAMYDVTFNDAHLDGSLDFSAVTFSGYDTPIVNLINCVPAQNGALFPPSAGPYRVVGDGVRVKTDFATTHTGSDTFNHGIKLGGAHPMAPSCVAVTPISSGITNLSVTNITATSFTVNCTPSNAEYLVHAWLNFPNP